MSTSPTSAPASATTLPLASTASSARLRAYTEFSTLASRTELAVGSPSRAIAQLEALGRAAVVLADDDILRDVDETTGEVTRVGGTESGVGQTLAGTVGGDEVLGHRQALAVATR